MDDVAILVGNKRSIYPVVVAIDEAVTRESYDITSEDIVLTKPALLKMKSAASGNIKVTLVGTNKTVITLDANDVNEANIHVEKVFKTGTTTGNTFYLWQ